jgi:hypothetical protein
LTNGTSYEFEVAATNGAGTGSFSAASGAVVPATTPGPPTGVAGTSNANTQSVVSWTTPASNGGLAITTYTIQYSSNGGTSWSTWGTNPATSPATVTGLVNGTGYIFQVAASNSLGLGTYSAVSATATPATVPGQPTGVSGTTHANTQSVVSWTAPASNGGATISAYTVQYSPSPYTTWTTATVAAGSSPYTVTGLTNGTSYEFRVSATNAAGTGAVSAVSAAVVPATTPGAPTIGTAVKLTGTTASVVWTAPASNGGLAITAYTVQYSTNGGTSWTTLTTVSAGSPYTATVTTGHNYIFQVAATNAVGTGAFSASSNSLSF